MKRTSFLVLVLEDLVVLHTTVHLQLFGTGDWATDLGYCDVERFALETNRDYSIVFETVLCFVHTY